MSQNHDPASALRVLQPLVNTRGGKPCGLPRDAGEGVPGERKYGRGGEAVSRDLSERSAEQPGEGCEESAGGDADVPLTVAERKQHADAMFNAHQYGDAAIEYRELRKDDTDLTQADRDALEIYAAVCDLKLKRLSRMDVEKLPVTGDDSAALKLYLQAELARNVGDTNGQDAAGAGADDEVSAEPVAGGGAVLGREHVSAPQGFGARDCGLQALVEHFPKSVYAPSAHWRAAWLSYRTRNYPAAARLMDEQIQNYPGGQEIPGALYWRGRLYEDVEHDFGQALNYYHRLDDAYVNSYYAMLARQRTAAMGKRDEVAAAPALAAVRHVDDPQLIDQLPENDPHLIKARLLANAALNEYIGPEIALSATSRRGARWREAEIYQSFGEKTRALQAMKRSGMPFTSLRCRRDSACVLGDAVSTAVLADLESECGCEWLGSVSRCGADSAGVGVQSGRGEQGECSRVDAIAAEYRES